MARSVFYILKEKIKEKLNMGEPHLYCNRCGGCGYVECCPAKMCDKGFGCDQLYTEEEINDVGIS